LFFRIFFFIFLYFYIFLFLSILLIIRRVVLSVKGPVAFFVILKYVSDLFIREHFFFSFKRVKHLELLLFLIIEVIIFINNRDSSLHFISKLFFLDLFNKFFSIGKSTSGSSSSSGTNFSILVLGKSRVRSIKSSRVWSGRSSGRSLRR
jgi:hypothetical protein